MQVVDNKRSKECRNQCPWYTDTIVTDQFCKNLSFFFKYPEFINKKIKYGRDERRCKKAGNLPQNSEKTKKEIINQIVRGK